ncbi:MAG: ATP-binding protein [Bacteroidetes bacterium]|nr:ATP-binding protein [Bacteroidota bacterium]
MKNILLIENDDIVIGRIVKAFNQENFLLDVAESCSKAYQMAIKNYPNLIICSSNLNESEGEESLFKLRNETFLSTVPFIFLISKESNLKPKLDKSLPFDFFISQPFADKELIKIANLAIERYSIVAEKTEQRLNELRGSLSFSLPHEFFTPLNSILGFTEILINDFNQLEKNEITQMLGYINSNAIRLKKITENFLLFAQLDMITKDQAALSALRKSYFINLKDIVISVSKLIAKEYSREDDLILELNDCVLRMTDGYLKKLVSEIIDNAFKFSEKGTQVIINLLSNDSSVMISVIDSGRGMNRDQIASIGAYMQFNRKLYEQQGSGLGLVIAKKITEIHGGQFNIESNTGEGTKVNVIFDI